MENQVLEEAVFRKVLKNIPLGLVVSKEGKQRKVYYVNQNAYEMMGYSREEYVALVENGWANFVHVDIRQIIRENHAQIRAGKAFEVLAKAKRKDGDERWLLHQVVVHLNEGPLCYVSYMDVTDRMEREQLWRKEEARLREQVMRDSFTKLYNRGTMEQIVGETLRNLEKAQHAYIALDVDDFKKINDDYGHAMGDMLILEVAKLLKKEFGQEAAVARMGGDEFAVFLKDVKKRETVSDTAERVLVKLRSQKAVLGFQKEPTLSIGIAFTPEGGASFSELYHRADEALYRVKNGEKNGVAVYGFS